MTQNQFADAASPLGVEMAVVEEIDDGRVYARRHRKIAERGVVAAGEESGGEDVLEKTLGLGNTDVEAPALQGRRETDDGRQKALIDRVQSLLLRVGGARGVRDAAPVFIPGKLRRRQMPRVRDRGRGMREAALA